MTETEIANENKLMWLQELIDSVPPQNVPILQIEDVRKILED